MRRTRLLAATAGALALGTLASPFAATADQSGTTTATFTLTNGSLAITTPAVPAALAQQASDSQLVFQGNLGSTTVIDSRNVTSGWVAYAKSTDFTNGSGGTVEAEHVTISVPLVNVTAQVLAGETGQDLFTPDADGTAGDGSDATWDHDDDGGTPAISAGGKIGEVVAADLTSALSDLMGLLGLGTLVANNEVTYNPRITVTAPAGTPAGSYSGTITQTVL